MVSRAFLFILAGAVLWAGSLFPAVAQAQTLTPQQLEQIRRLTPQQKRELREALGLNSPAEATPVESDTEVEPVVGLPEDAEETPEERGLAPGDYLVVEITAAEDVEIELASVEAALGRNVYQVDSQGRLAIAGMRQLVVDGLTPEQAELRLSAEPVFRDFDITVYRLMLTPRGSRSLQRFGDDLFNGVPSTFAPDNNVPVPLDYVVGPRDVISVLLFGQLNASYSLTVNRDGSILIPEIGPMAVVGMRFNELREELTKRVQERFIGVDVSVTMGELRSVQVFVLGDVRRPGSYTVSSLSSMTNALFASGGIAETGSMRDIQLKRRNKVVGTLDLYELLLKGNTLGDRRIRSGDVIYVPPVGPQVSVFGEINRPAIYELKGQSDLISVMAMAGGLLPSADRKNVKVERFTGEGEKGLRVFDLDRSGSVDVENGDQIELLPVSTPVLGNSILVVGHVDLERSFEWRPGLRALDVIPRPENFLVGADQNYLLVHRTDDKTGLVNVLSFDWRAAFLERRSPQNIELRPKDVIHVFDLSPDRAARIAPILTELDEQASGEKPNRIVAIQGPVRAPGDYPFQENMRISDLLRASGSLLENAYLDEAELTRQFREATTSRTEHITVNLNGLVPGDANDMLLAPSDVLTVKEMPLWREARRVKILGEVAFPGAYSASRGERLSSVIERAGGLTNQAFLNGSVFVRLDLKKREEAQLSRLRARLETEVRSLEVTDAEASSRGQALLDRLEEAEAVGRLVIDLNLALAGDLNHDVILEDGDELVIPPVSQEVTVIGEVQYPTSHIYEENVDHIAYINKSGGSTHNADMKRVYVIKASGNVVVQGGSNWFRRPGGVITVEPGDTIVVPFDTDRVASLTLWSSVSQILYNIGVAAAAVASF